MLTRIDVGEVTGTVYNALPFSVGTRDYTHVYKTKGTLNE